MRYLNLLFIILMFSISPALAAEKAAEKAQESGNNYYSVIDITYTPKTKEDWGTPYRKVATALVNEYGGAYIARTDSFERIEGDRENVNAFAIIKWPSRQAAINFMKDPRYKEHLANRTKNTKSTHFLVEAKVRQ